MAHWVTPGLLESLEKLGQNRGWTASEPRMPFVPLAIQKESVLELGRPRKALEFLHCREPVSRRGEHEGRAFHPFESKPGIIQLEFFSRVPFVLRKR